MKAFVLAGTLFVFLPVASGQAKILTNDPLPALPLMPPTESAKKVGNEPVKMPVSAVCKSKMQGNFYSLYNYFSKDNIKLTDAIAWHTSHLSSFKKVAGSGNAQTVFYNSDGALLVIVSSEADAKDGVTKTRSVTYERYQPGLSDKTIFGFTQNKMACP
jgi:hypothetical protein